VKTLIAAQPHICSRYGQRFRRRNACFEARASLTRTRTRTRTVTLTSQWGARAYQLGSGTVGP
jgi:hypothetical protein